MTLNGAIMQLVELSEHPRMPIIFRPAIQKVIETISELEEKPEPHWIPVTDVLPNIREDVLVSYYDEVMVGWLIDDSTWFADGFGRLNINDIVAWMPLPEPMRMEKQSNCNKMPLPEPYKGVNT